jgi:hypothetical protein
VGGSVDRVIVGCVDAAVIQAMAQLNIDIRTGRTGTISPFESATLNVVFRETPPFG